MASVTRLYITPHSFSDPPWAPGKPVIRDIGKTSALLAWTRPEHDGGAKIEGYIIEFQKAGSEEWIRIADDVPQTEHQLQGLMEKQEYSFRVKALNKAGESEASEPSDLIICKERLCKSRRGRFNGVFFVCLFFNTARSGFNTIYCIIRSHEFVLFVSLCELTWTRTEVQQCCVF